MLTTSAADLGALVRQRRDDLGMSQTDLGHRVGTTRQWISRFEKGKADVSLSRTLAILHALDMTLDVRSRERRTKGVLSEETMARMKETIAASLPVSFSESTQLRMDRMLARYNEQGVGLHTEIDASALLSRLAIGPVRESSDASDA